MFNTDILASMILGLLFTGSLAQGKFWLSLGDRFLASTLKKLIEDKPVFLTQGSNTSIPEIGCYTCHRVSTVYIPNVPD